MKIRASFVPFLVLPVLVLAACGSAATAPPSAPPSAPPTAQPTALPPSPSPASLITFHSPEDAGFRLPLSLTHGPEWEVHVGINALDIVQSNTWGPSIFLVNGAKVADPSDMTNTIPWPDDFFTYFASMPGVKVIQGPEPVTIGGIAGSQVVVHVSSFGPFLWLKDDYTWIGSKAQDEKWQLVVVDVRGERVLLWFPDSPTTFDVRYPIVQQIYETISFAK